MDSPSPSGAVDTCPLCAHSMIFDSGPSWSRIHSTFAAMAWSRGEKLPDRSTECISTACRTISKLCRANVHSFSEDASTYTFFRSSSHSNKDSIISPVFCQKYLDLLADSRSRSASLKGASTVEATLASPGSTFSRYLSAFLTATCATCMSNPKNFTLFVCFGSWLYLRIHRIMSSTSSVFQVQKYKLSSASVASPVPFNTKSLIARDSGQFASIPKTVKPFFSTRNSSMRCFSWKNSRVPCVASPMATMRAFPMVDSIRRRSSHPLSGLVLSRGMAALLNHDVTSLGTEIEEGDLAAWPGRVGETASSRTRLPSAKQRLIETSWAILLSATQHQF